MRVETFAKGGVLQKVYGVRFTLDSYWPVIGDIKWVNWDEVAIAV